MPDKGALVAIARPVVMVLSPWGWRVLRQRRAANPLYDLHIAGRRVFWVAAFAGIIVFGSLMAAVFIGQQYLQNVLGYSTLSAGASILPGALLMVLVAAQVGQAHRSRGARHPPAGYVFVWLAS